MSRLVTPVASRATRRLLRVSVEAAAARGLVSGLAIATLVLLLAALVFRWFDPSAPSVEAARTLALAIATGSAAIGLALPASRAIGRGPTLLAGAQALDRALGLEGRVAAAIDLEGALESEPAREPLALLAIEDARARLGTPDLAAVIPTRWTSELPALPLLALATLGLAVAVMAHVPEDADQGALASVAEPRELGSPAEREQLARAAEALAREAQSLARRAAAIEGVGANGLAANGVASASAAETANAARDLSREAQGPGSRRAALNRLAAARGRIDAARSDGLAEGIEAAAQALEGAQATRALGRALAEGDEAAAAVHARELADQVASKALSDDALAETASAVTKAAKALGRAGTARPAKDALDNLGKALDRPGGQDPGAAAAEVQKALPPLARELASDGVAGAAQNAIEKARETSAPDTATAAEKGSRGERGDKPEKGESSEKPGEKGSPEKGRPGDKGEKKPGSGREDDKKSGGVAEGRGAGDGLCSRECGCGGPCATCPGLGGDCPLEGGPCGCPRCRMKGGGGRGRPDAKDGPPAEGANGSRSVAGKGEGDPSGVRAAEPSSEEPGEQARLRGALGERGARAVFTVRAASKAGPRALSREVYVEYLRLEEERVARERVPAGRAELIRRYFELIRPEPEPERPR